MAGDCLADIRAAPRDQVEHSGWKPDLVYDLGQNERVQWGNPARLEHHGAAGSQSRRDLGSYLM